MKTIQGTCDQNKIHPPHVHQPIGWAGTLWECPGQHSQCRNCDDRKCMGCVFREHPHDCKDDCPDCCNPPEPEQHCPTCTCGT